MIYTTPIWWSYSTLPPFEVFPPFYFSFALILVNLDSLLSFVNWLTLETIPNSNPEQAAQPLTIVLSL